jgi:hypothetical protein
MKDALKPICDYLFKELRCALSVKTAALIHLHKVNALLARDDMG